MGDLVREDLERVYTIPSRGNNNKLSPNDDSEKTKDKYNWNQQWYPIHAVDTIDKTIPQKAYLLGKEMVIWYSESEEKWNVFEDACPHRQGPLSEGRIDKVGMVSRRSCAVITDGNLIRQDPATTCPIRKNCYGRGTKEIAGQRVSPFRREWKTDCSLSFPRVKEMPN